MLESMLTVAAMAAVPVAAMPTGQGPRIEAARGIIGTGGPRDRAQLARAQQTVFHSTGSSGGVRSHNAPAAAPRASMLRSTGFDAHPAGHASGGDSSARFASAVRAAR